MEPYLLEKQQHIDDIIKTRETSVMLNLTKALCMSNISAKFQWDWIKDGEATAILK